MAQIKPASYTTPDGVERKVRFTNGARKRIHDYFSMDLREAMNRYGDAALAGALYLCMFDEDGNPPKDLSLGRFAENVNGEDSEDMLSSLLAACSNGQVEKKTILEALQRVREMQSKSKESTTGTPSGDSQESTLESPEVPPQVAATAESSGT